MWDTAAGAAITSPGYIAQEETRAANTAREIVIQAEHSRGYMLASQQVLSTLWMTPEEDEAWKDL